MIIAPIVSPMLTASVGAVRNDREMLLDSIHQQLLGLGVGTLAAITFSYLAKEFFAVPTALDIATMSLVTGRIAPSILSLVIGFAAGAAGAYGLSTKGQVSIVGVMIAAALIPVAAVSGIGVAWGRYQVGFGALVLLVLTIISVNVGGYLMLLYLGYRPDSVDEGLLERPDGRQALVLGATTLLVLGLVVTVGTGSYQHTAFERTVNDAATEVLTQDQYSSLGITEISTEYAAAGRLSENVTVTVVLSRSDDREYPDLPEALDRHITRRTGEDVVIQVRYLDFERSDRLPPAGGQSRG